MVPNTAAYSNGKIFIALGNGEPKEISKGDARALGKMLLTITSHVQRKEDCNCKENRERERRAGA